MLLVGKDHLEDYLKNDYILKALNNCSYKIDNSFISYKWLIDSPPKRLIYDKIYSDLLNTSQDKLNILDIGGGYTSLTRSIVNNHNYQLLEIFSHDAQQKLDKLKETYPNTFWINDDWNNNTPKENFDLVIANDLFPNVDQRLELFLNKYLEISKEIRLSLTFYNENRFYKVKRVDADEILWLLAWNGEQVAHCLKKFEEYIVNLDLQMFSNTPESLFPNKRQVVIVTLKNNI